MSRILSNFEGWVKVQLLIRKKCMYRTYAIAKQHRN